MDVKQRFNTLLDKKEEAKKQKVMLETRIESAQESMEAVKTEWQEKYGVSSLEEAKQKLSEMETSVNEGLAECEKYLEEAGV